MTVDMACAFESKKAVVYFIFKREKDQIVYQVEAPTVEEVELMDDEIEFQGFHPTVVSTDHDSDN